MKIGWIKRLTSGILVAVFTIISVCGNAYAKDSNDTTIQSVSQLESAIEVAAEDGNISVAEKQDILNNTPDDVKVAYVLSLQDEMTNVVATNETFKTLSVTEGGTEEIISNVYKINEAVDVELVIEDEDEGQNNARGAVAGGSVKKDLGNRKTTGTYKCKLLGITIITAKLTLGYTVNKTNLTARYATTSKTVTVGSVTSSAKITDSKAAEVGHDMNCVGTYNINIAGYAGVEMELELIVKWYSDVDSDTKYLTYNLYLL